MKARVVRISNRQNWIQTVVRSLHSANGSVVEFQIAISDGSVFSGSYKDACFKPLTHFYVQLAAEKAKVRPIYVCQDAWRVRACVFGAAAAVRNQCSPRYGFFFGVVGFRLLKSGGGIYEK